MAEPDPLPSHATITITITYDQVTGAVNVAGLPMNKVLGFGLLELSILTAQAAYQAQGESPIIPVRAFRPQQNSH